jgi:hypothetical protein
MANWDALGLRNRIAQAGSVGQVTRYRPDPTQVDIITPRSEVSVRATGLWSAY